MPQFRKMDWAGYLVERVVLGILFAFPVEEWRVPVASVAKRRRL
ncbi:MAG: hypothetical protein R3192_04345 [Woeseiaceae bacterium]|nr:hypothetical protein [Woeseiaceae bacterium]